MKAKILIILFARMILSISNPAVGQQISGDPVSEAKQVFPPIAIPWQYPSIFETDGGRLMEEAALYDLYAPDSALNGGLMKLETAPEDDHCEEVKTNLTPTCSTDYEFINEPVTIQ